ncbi:MAG: DHHW family protein [Oscillospiraceae bacterium]
MSSVQGFQKKQVPVAIVLTIAIAVVIILILVFGGKQQRILNDKTTAASASTTKQEAKSTTKKETTTQKAPPPISTPAEYTTSSSIIISGTSAMEMYGISPKSLQRYAETINAFSTLVPKSQVYVLLAPTAMEFYGPEKFNTGNRSQDAGIKLAYAALAKNVKSVDSRSALRMHTDEYIYFRTDHHWTARGAYYAYTAFAKTAGFNPSKLDTYTVGKVDGFVGSMYRYTQAQVLKDNPDYVETFTPKTPATGLIFSDATMTQSRPLTIVASSVAAGNKYLAFIQGDNPIIKITTGNKNGRKIILIKESYGNAFAPFLIDNYEEVYVTDPRKIDMNLASFANANGINDILFLNYTFAPSNSTYMTAFLKMLGQ